MAFSQIPIQKVWAEDTANKSSFTQDEIGSGIVYAANVVSNQLNGVSNQVYLALQFLQHTGGMYNALIPYTNPDVVGLITYNGGIYKVNYYLRKTTNPSSTTNNPPITGATISTVNGIDVYSGGSANSDWQNLEEDVYNFYVKYPYADPAGTIQNQTIAYPGIVSSISAVLLTDATGADFIVNVLNNGNVVKKNTDTYTFADVTNTSTVKTDSNTNTTLVTGQALGVSIQQVGSSVVGQDLLIQVRSIRT